MTAVPIARVLIDSPLPQLDRLFDYAIPAALADGVRPGVRVRVPLRTVGRIVDALVVEVDALEAPPRPLSDVEAVVSEVPVLTPRLYALARRAADRAAGSAGDILRLVIPRRMVRAEKAWLAGDRTAPPPVAADAAAQAASVLAAYPGLADALGQERRLALTAIPHPVALPGGDQVGEWALLLAASAVHTLGRGRTAVLVVPDHRDQAQALAALRGLAPDGAVVAVDARQTSPERYAAYLRTLEPHPRIIVGNRSAVYAPADRLGLVAIWDDGDPLLSEPLSPGVHARDAALLRQELDGGALLFAGHTRTTDVERLVAIGWVSEVAPQRPVRPKVVLTAVREGEQAAARLPSAAYAAAREAVRTGPVLIQVARPGYAPSLRCATCGQVARCAHCAGPLRLRDRRSAPVCGWCGRSASPWTCGECGATRMRMAGAGTERTADELGRAFPGVRIIVADGDHPVLRVDDRPALVIATRGAEPIADGGYRCVLLLDGDRMLQAEDLRIGEACLRWWSNAAALAAPSAPVHLVGVGGAIARSLATWSQPAYARRELADRAPLRMPPTVRVAAVEGERAAVEGALRTLRTDVPSLDEGAVLGPVPMADHVRALVRFDYAAGPAVAASLRASVIGDALAGRRGRSPANRRNTLRVRADVPDPDL